MAGLFGCCFFVAFSGGGIGEWPGFLAASVFVVPRLPDLNAFAIVLVSFYMLEREVRVKQAHSIWHSRANVRSPRSA